MPAGWSTRPGARRRLRHRSRIAARLHGMGYDVVGVDADESILTVARAEAPHLDWRLADLVAMDLRAGSTWWSWPATRSRCSRTGRSRRRARPSWRTPGRHRREREFGQLDADHLPGDCPVMPGWPRSTPRWRCRPGAVARHASLVRVRPEPGAGYVVAVHGRRTGEDHRPAGISAEAGADLPRRQRALGATGSRTRHWRRTPCSPDVVHRFYDERGGPRSPGRAERRTARSPGWSRRRRRALVITQNVDDLHERAGVGPGPCTCTDSCGRRSASRAAPAASGPGTWSHRRPCPRCGRWSCWPDVVWFGEIPYGMDLIAAAIAHRPVRVDRHLRCGLPAAGFVQRVPPGHGRWSSTWSPAAAPACSTSLATVRRPSLVPAWVAEVLSSRGAPGRPERRVVRAAGNGMVHSPVGRRPTPGAGGPMARIGLAMAGLSVGRRCSPRAVAATALRGRVGGRHHQGGEVRHGRPSPRWVWRHHLRWPADQPRPSPTPTATARARSASATARRSCSASTEDVDEARRGFWQTFGGGSWTRSCRWWATSGC